MQRHQSIVLGLILCFFISVNEMIADGYISLSELNGINEKTVESSNISSDSIQEYRVLAIKFANNIQAKEATNYIIKYISATSDMSFLNDHLFKAIENSTEYQALKQKYSPRVGLLGLFYFCTGLLGVFVFIILNLKKSDDKISNFLISLFVLFHSVFILHQTLYVVNSQFYLPHALFVSTTFSFLYGPLLYFYSKRIMCNYKFKLVDALHLLPSVILLIYIFPYYIMSRLEKFNEVFDQENTLLPGAHMIIIVKILSLSIYTYLLLRIYYKNKAQLSHNDSMVRHLWKRNIIALHGLYTLAYIIFATVLVKIINIPILFHLQSLVMVSVVFYVAYISYIRPEIFMGKIKLGDPSKLFKYKKSGLTPSYSVELKIKLMKLLDEDKIYKENDISLQYLSEKMDTTRHNTSQVINEHFEMSFSELMNNCRIIEAADIFQKDSYNSLSIIEVAYEVGFNNKVSFNKSFKKQFELTPSEYIRSLRL